MEESVDGGEEIWASSTEELIEGQVVGKGGYLWKRGEAPHREYKLRWFQMENVGSMVKGAQWVYYEDETKSRRKGLIDIGKITQVSVGNPDWEDSVDGSVAGYTLHLTTPGRVWELKCATELIRNRWLAQLRSLCFGDVAPIPSAPRLTDEWDWRKLLQRSDGEHKIRATVTRAQLMRAPSGSRYTAYVVTVETNAGFMFSERTQWNVYRRFSEFSDLWTELLSLNEVDNYQKVTGRILKPLPPRDWTGRFDAHVIEYRRQCFQEMLNYILECLATLNHGLAFFPLKLRAFLSPPPPGSVQDKEKPVVGWSDVPKVTVEPPSVEATLPTLFRFQPMVLYPSRRAALLQYLEGTQDPISVTQAYNMVVAVAQFNPTHRVDCIRQLLPRVKDRQRLFVLFQDMTPHFVEEIQAIDPSQ